MDLELIARLERVLLATWTPLEVEERNGWIVAANEGFTGRANSLSVHDQGPPAHFDEQLAWAEEWYRRRTITPSARITPISEAVGHHLAEHGYDYWKPGATVMTAPLEQLAELEGPASVTGHATPTADWDRVSDQSPAIRATLAKMRSRTTAPVRHTEAALGDRTLAIGRGALDDGHLMISGMVTLPEARGQGLARAVIADLARWAIAEGSTVATLQVETGNDNARRLYEWLGFVPVYDYTYVRASIVA